MIHTKDLTKEAPRSPRVRIKDYVILARTLDKCRADLAGKIGDYHFDCPLDNVLFGFKGVHGSDFRRRVEMGASDEEIGEWIESQGISRTPEEVRLWSSQVEANSLNDDPEKRDWFAEQCKALGLNPETTTVFDWLEADDSAVFKSRG